MFKFFFVNNSNTVTRCVLTRRRFIFLQQQMFCCVGLSFKDSSELLSQVDLFNRNFQKLRTKNCRSPHPIQCGVTIPIAVIAILKSHWALILVNTVDVATFSTSLPTFLAPQPYRCVYALCPGFFFKCGRFSLIYSIILSNNDAEYIPVFVLPSASHKTVAITLSADFTVFASLAAVHPQKSTFFTALLSLECSREHMFRRQVHIENSVGLRRRIAKTLLQSTTSSLSSSAQKTGSGPGLT